MLNMQKKAVIITGATCSGKSAHALVYAKKYNGIIINADSMQVYDTFPILSAQPAEEDFAFVEHKMYSFLNYNQNYSVKQWLEDVSININNVLENGKLPIIVGGTGMYVNALLNGISIIPDIPFTVTQGLNNLLISSGVEFLYNKLLLLDPDYALCLKKNDKQRIIRALAVLETTDKSITHFWNNNYKYCSDVFFEVLLKTLPREDLYNRINNRVIQMFENGAIEEVEYFNKLFSVQTLENGNNIKTIGVNEILMYLSEKISLNEAIQKTQQLTRNYAKRQCTWFNNQLLHFKTV
jgi:tRNA dimethylallyltransferase